MELNHGLIHQIYSLPELIRRQYADLEPKARSVLDTPEIFGIQRIVLTGCRIVRPGYLCRIDWSAG